MEKNTLKNIINANNGETLVEVMVAFVVLMIVLAMFSGAINSASSSVMNSIDMRRTSDTEYTELRKVMAKEERESSLIAYNSNPGTETPGRTGVSNTITLEGSSITLDAVQYRSGDTVYWVFR